MTISRTHIDRVNAYVNGLPDDSGMPWFSETSDHSRLIQALCLAANLHNPDLIVALTKTRSVTDSADDLDTIADRKGMDADTARSMRHVAEGLRSYDAEHAEGVR